MRNILLTYLRSLSPNERAELAERAGSSASSLRLAANGYKTNGELSVTAEFASRIEKATKGKLPRTKLCKTCAACPYAKACKDLTL